jgi:tRNA dimethylallyltransferase
MATPDKTLIVIAGPTAIGKTAMAIQVAKYFQTEILSADSRQFYKETLIGTAKPSDTELSEVKHHFINSHSITETFTVGDFEVQALELLTRLFQAHDSVVLTGGSGLYINAICSGLDNLPKSNEALRNELNQGYKEKGIQYLQEEVKKVDPAYYEKADTSNPQRLIRALEVYRSTGIPFSEYRTGSEKKRPFNIIKIGLNTAREQLYRQVNHRVDQMVERGLLDEAAALYPLKHLNALNTVGYSEVFDYMDGKYSMDKAIDKIKQNTRNFAKRQLTWFRRDPEIQWFEPDQYSGIINYIMEKIKSPKPGR